jgi:hypothetical protein
MPDLVDGFTTTIHAARKGLSETAPVPVEKAGNFGVGRWYARCSGAIVSSSIDA